MIIEKQQLQGHTLIKVEGVIKLGQSAGFFVDALKKTLAEDRGDVLVELSRINYIDSTGIGELVGHLVKLQENRRKLVLIGPNERIRRLLKTAHVDSLFVIFDTLDEALDGLS